VLVLDTNVLVYAADDAAPEQESCRAAVERCRAGRQPWYLTWTVVYEFLRVVTHPRVLRRPRTVEQAWSFVTAVLSAPTAGMLVATHEHAEVAAQFLAEHGTVLRGNLLHDAHTAILMREHGIRRIVTRDADFHRFGGLDVVDPLATP